MKDIMEQGTDLGKVAIATAAPMASLYGLTVEEWSYALSAVVALLFILEKLIRAFLWIRSRKKNESPRCE